MDEEKLPQWSTVIGENLAMTRLYAWKQYWRRGGDLPEFSEPVRIGGVWHSGPWFGDGACGACGGRVALLSEGTGWMIPACSVSGLHDSLSFKDHLRIQRAREE